MPESQRTLLNIIWSCVSTVIICAWTAVHPNIPPPSKWRARWNRLKILFWMIIAPELVLAWAARQYFSAKEIRDAYNESRPGLPEWKRWTLTHGYFFQMGGFTIAYLDRKDKNPKEQRATVLTFDDLKQNPNIQFPDLTAADLDDRSRGDPLTKLIAMIQTSWFILHCIARRHRNIAITELELATLALASLNAVTFLFWWYKPLAVEEPVRLYWPAAELTRVDESDEHHAQHENEYYTTEGDGVDTVILSFREVLSRGAKDLRMAAVLCLHGIRHASTTSIFITTPINAIYVLSSPVFMLFPLGITALLMVIKTDPVDSSPPASEEIRGLVITRIVITLKKFQYGLTSSIARIVGSLVQQIFQVSESFMWMFRWYILLPSIFFLLLLFLAFFLIPLFVVTSLISFTFKSIFGIVTTSFIPPGADHVPSFYATRTKSDRWSRMVVFAFFGVAFGGIHCIGWDLTFPSQFEQNLWRGTSVAITVIPFVVAPIDFILANSDLDNCGLAERVVLLLIDLVMTMLFFIYVPARLSLLAQAIALLRHQPEDAFLSVQWTTYIPHIWF